MDRVQRIPIAAQLAEAWLLCVDGAPGSWGYAHYGPFCGVQVLMTDALLGDGQAVAPAVSLLFRGAE